MKCGIYQITCTENELIYIGSSKHIEKRWTEHKWALNNNTHVNMFLQADWNEYGEDSFIFEVIEECNEDDRYTIEQKYLDELKPYYRNGRGYNISENSERQNNTNLRIFKEKFRRPNPFYQMSDGKVKQMLKEIDDFGEYKYRDYFGRKIDTNARHEWFEIEDNYSYVEYRGMFGQYHVRKIDNDMVDNMSRDELEDYVYALDTYNQIASYMREFGDPDDWD